MLLGGVGNLEIEMLAWHLNSFKERNLKSGGEIRHCRGATSHEQRFAYQRACKCRFRIFCEISAIRVRCQPLYGLGSQ